MSQSASNNGFILQPEDLATKIQEWKAQGFHVLSPAIQMSTFAPGYGVNASLVLLDPTVDPDGGGLDVYFDKTTMTGDLSRAAQDTDERAPSKIGLMKIAAAAGVSWVKPYGRQDPLTIQNLWIYQVTGVYLAYDGTPQTIKGEKEIDYRDGSAQIGEWSREAQAAMDARNKAMAPGARAEYSINGWSEKRVRQARTNGAERAETGALERAIRTLGVKHIYTIGELKRPFVALRVCPVVDTADPAARALIAERQLMGVAALYAGATTAAATPRALPEAYIPAPIIEAQPVREPVRASQPQAAAPRAQQPATPPPPSAPPAPPPTRPVRDLDEGPDDAELDEDEAKAHAQGVRAPLPAGAVYIERCDAQQKKYGPQHRKAGQSFTKWVITDSQGEVFVTVYPKWGNEAASCYESGAPVIIQAGDPNQYREREILNIQKAGPAVGTAGPALPLEPAAMKL